MLQNSKYSVWFKTPQGEGYGIVSLMDGNLSGGDNISSYTGTYVQDGDKFAATIAVRRPRFSLRYTSNMQPPSAAPNISLSRGKGVTKMQQLALDEGREIAGLAH
jgi:hypothetical protein